MKRLMLFLLLVTLTSSFVAFAQDRGNSIHLVTIFDPGNFNPIFQTNTLLSRLA